MSPAEQFPGLGKNQAELFRGEFLQQLFQRLETDRWLVTFMKQNDGTRNDRSFDTLNNFAGIIDLGVKGPDAPADQLETACRKDRMQERIFQTGRRSKPDRCGYTNRRDCRLKFVNFPNQRTRTKAPEAEPWMGLGVISDGVTRIEYRASQLRMFSRFCTDQKKRGASAVLCQQRKSLRRRAGVGSVVDGQPSGFRGRAIFRQDGSEPLKRWDEGDGHEQQMRGEQNR